MLRSYSLCWSQRNIDTCDVAAEDSSSSTTAVCESLTLSENLGLWPLNSNLDSVYRFCCEMFGKNVSSLSDTNEFSGWQHLSLTLKRHKTSQSYNENLKSLKQLNNTLLTKNTVNHMQLRLIEKGKKHCCAVLERIIIVIKFLSRQCLTFRGSSKEICVLDKGNFLKAVETLAPFDSVMREHIRRIESKSDPNCTSGASRTEQITVIFRHVYLNHTDKKVEVCEHFIGFCPIIGSSG
ncbi:zinc finger MYM-type protein 1-like [Schistocerca americana]|uniref:zinc finger MYM-type protein 1-like n=1 Tax=Schistocerca americana TaxID=7009 RepID=UPI001F4FC2F9|nr:zinc finger MYM-type protein 1-like [Schistocerca americana]